ncbi:hypothetical protein MRX96_000619 [Rhipicephalus microplus]
MGRNPRRTHALRQSPLFQPSGGQLMGEQAKGCIDDCSVASVVFAEAVLRGASARGRLRSIACPKDCADFTRSARKGVPQTVAVPGRGLSQKARGLLARGGAAAAAAGLTTSTAEHERAPRVLLCVRPDRLASSSSSWEQFCAGGRAVPRQESSRAAAALEQAPCRAPRLLASNLWRHLTRCLENSPEARLFRPSLLPSVSPLFVKMLPSQFIASVLES